MKTPITDERAFRGSLARQRAFERRNQTNNLLEKKNREHQQHIRNELLDPQNRVSTEFFALVPLLMLKLKN